MADIFESTSDFVFVLFFIYAVNAVTEKDLLACFDGTRRANSVTENGLSESFDSPDLVEEDFITPLVKTNAGPEKSNIDSNQVVKAEFDWREAEKLLMKFGSKRWNEINEDDIVPVDDDLFVMEAKRHVCSILTRDRNPKNHKFEPITHSLFTSRNIEIPVWESNKYETKTLLCLTTFFCTWEPMNIEVIGCPCRITSKASYTTPVESISLQRSQSNPERRKIGVPKQDDNITLELQSGSSRSSTFSSRNHLGISSGLSTISEKVLKNSLKLAKSHERYLDNALRQIRSNNPRLSSWLGLRWAPEPVFERSLKLKRSHESALSNLSELTEGPELALGSSRSDKPMLDSSGLIEDRKSVSDSSLKLSGSYQTGGTSALIWSSEPNTETAEEQSVPPTYALPADEICMYSGGIWNYVYFSRGVRGENSFFVYAKTGQAEVLRVVSHLVLPEAENDNNLGLSLNLT